MEKLGDKVRALRKQHSLTIRQLGEALGVHNSYITQVETGRVTPSLKLAVRMADFFSVSVDSLVKDDIDID
jgi:transcriptional regulator with XRE-family HTH domain